MEYKNYLITPDKLTPSNYRIATAGRGGKIPDLMDGLFTSPNLAKEVIDVYLEKKEVENDKKINKG